LTLTSAAITVYQHAHEATATALRYASYRGYTFFRTFLLSRSTRRFRYAAGRDNRAGTRDRYFTSLRNDRLSPASYQRAAHSSGGSGEYLTTNSNTRHRRAQYGRNTRHARRTRKCAAICTGASLLAWPRAISAFASHHLHSNLPAPNTAVDQDDANARSTT